MNSTVKTSGRFSKSRGLRASVPSFPSPTPFLPLFCSRPIFCAARMRKTPSRGPNFVRFVRERLLRRLIRKRWPVHNINPVDKTKISYFTPHKRRITGSLETYSSYQFVNNKLLFVMISRLNFLIYMKTQSLIKKGDWLYYHSLHDCSVL